MPATKLLPIVLSARRKSWRMSDVHAGEADARYLKIRKEILERDDHTCAFCGFRALRFQEMHHLDDDHANNRPANLVTACCFCHCCFHLGMAGIRRTGTLIWCPELSQADINNTVRAIFVAEASGIRHDESAKALYAAFASRAEVVEQEFGTGASNPAAVGQALLDMTPEQYKDRRRRLGGLRLLPRSAAFGPQIAYWQTSADLFGDMDEDTWGALLPAEEPSGAEAAEAETDAHA